MEVSQAGEVCLRHRAKYWAYTPPERNAGPLPLVRLEEMSDG